MNDDEYLVAELDIGEKEFSIDVAVRTSGTCVLRMYTDRQYETTCTAAELQQLANTISMIAQLASSTSGVTEVTHEDDDSSN